MDHKNFHPQDLVIQSKRFQIVAFTEEMAQVVHENSLDVNNRRFLPDEVYHSTEDAKEAIKELLLCYKNGEGPFVYPIILNTGENIGYVQIVPMKEDKWEVGYHIAEKYTGNGYAAEAVNAFLPVILPALDLSEVWGICHGENYASHRVLEKCSFVLRSTDWDDYLGTYCFVRKYIFTCR